METRDVVVVGGGIAGCAAGAALAAKGVDVLVLERQEEYADHVRGEGMAPWGVIEAERLGVDGVMVAAGGSYVPRVANFDEAWPSDTATVNDLTDFGLKGFLHVGHPDACRALATAAVQAGASVQSGAEVRSLRLGDRPSVTFADANGAEHEIACRIVIGADGRRSSVRRHAGLELHETEALTYGGGLLVEGGSWPEDLLGMGTEGTVHYLVAPRPGVARLYLFTTPDLAKQRFAGADKAASFLAAFRLSSTPVQDAFATARPKGPCAFFAMTDSWVEDPTSPGAVLVGDAAGWNNPIIGQGLAIALRDARQVVDVLTSSDDWQQSAFSPYVRERRERMRRLRATAFVDTCISSAFDVGATARRIDHEGLVQSDPLIGAYRVGRAIGVDDLPAAAYDEQTVVGAVGRDHAYLRALPGFALGT